jgi:hypothetical protein
MVPGTYLLIFIQRTEGGGEGGYDSKLSWILKQKTICNAITRQNTHFSTLIRVKKSYLLVEIVETAESMLLIAPLAAEWWTPETALLVTTYAKKKKTISFFPR